MGINEQKLKYLWINILRGFLLIAKVFYELCHIKACGISGKQPLGERRLGGIIYKKKRANGPVSDFSLAKAGRYHRNASVPADF